MDTVYRKKNGECVPVEVVAKDISFGGHQARIVMAHDITERKLVQQLVTLQYCAAKILADSRTQAEAISRLLETMCRTLNWRMAVLWTVRPDEKVIRSLNPDPAERRSCRDRHRGHGDRYPRSGSEPDLRPLLHHQGGRQGHRAGADDLPRRDR
jgi:hypothetical protein